MTEMVMWALGLIESTSGSQSDISYQAIGADSAVLFNIINTIKIHVSLDTYTWVTRQVVGRKFLL